MRPVPRFSSRVSGERRPNAFSLAVAEKRRRGARLLDLTGSNPTECGFRSHLPKILKPLSKKAALRYAPDPRGEPAAREAVCAYYRQKGVSLRPGQIFLTASTSEAYHYLFRLLCGPGDRVAFGEPSYPLLDSLASLDDVAPAKYALHYEKSWRIDPVSLSAASQDARAVIAVHPNNPTGHFISGEERETLGLACEKNGAALIVDEVFHDFAWNPPAPPSFAGHAAPAFVLSGVSKILGLPQMKLSWIVVAGPRGFQDEAAERLETIADAYLSVNTPAQSALSAWLRSGGTVTREILGRVRENRRALEKELAGHARLSALAAEGGWYSVLRFRSDRDDEAMALYLLNEKELCVQPGYLYDLSEGHLVLSLLAPPKVFLEGVRRLGEAVYN